MRVVNAKKRVDILILIPDLLKIARPFSHKFTRFYLKTIPKGKNVGRVIKN